MSTATKNKRVREALERLFAATDQAARVIVELQRAKQALSRAATAEARRSKGGAA